MSSMKTFELSGIGSNRAVPLIGHETLPFLLLANGPWARPHEHGPSHSVAGIIDAARAVLNSLLTRIEDRMERARILNGLERLDDRMLADIGLQRSDLADYVAQMQVKTPPSFLRRVWRDMKAAAIRRATARELRALSDAVLTDIGIERGQIDAYVAGELDGGSTATGAARREAKASLVGKLTRPLRQWNLSRHAASDMVRIDGELMSDIGYVKGDVDWVPEVLAKRRLDAANRNGKGTQAA